ncbi:hypothetical protein PIB30_040815, partial [Stylosanthes scabra]|nr:hypothetical protein [Stylosanthes scabra]
LRTLFLGSVVIQLRGQNWNLSNSLPWLCRGHSSGCQDTFPIIGAKISTICCRGKTNTGKPLNWEDRLQMALDAAQGLEYLHNGCKAPIIHRDVKCTNILLNGNLHAKLADFGLSKCFAADGDTHVSTIVAGTPGYLDPEYTTSNRLTEKSDVYSFGVVLLRIITGQAVIIGTEDMTHRISQQVKVHDC